MYGFSTNSYGVYGTSSSATGVGVFGSANTGYGGYFTSATGKALVTQNGNVGIGILSPNLNSDEIMDISKRLRVRHGSTNAGIWFNNTSNTITAFDGAFFGMKTATAGSETAGIWLNNDWRFYVDRSGNTTIGGGLSVGGGDVINKIIKTTASVDLPAITAGSVIGQQVTVTGAAVGDVAVVNIEGTMGLLIVSNVQVISANTVEISIYNASGANIDKPAMNFRFVVYK